VWKSAGLGPEKLPFQFAVSLGQDSHAGNANRIHALPKEHRARDIAVHHPPNRFRSARIV
jgi:hypothetical protein